MSMAPSRAGDPLAAAAIAIDFGRAVGRRLRPRNLAVALGVLALAVFFSAAFTPIFGAQTSTLVARLTSTVITAASVLLAIVVADEAVDRGAPRVPSYVVAVFAGAAIGALSGWPLREALGLRFSFQGRAPEADVAVFARYHRLDQFLVGILLGGLATFVHVNRRTALAARRRQHEAERARAGAQRRTLESQLQALQARVEPMFLFETLDRIHALYRGNVGEANQMLEDLIVYLRAALPHLRESTSTVEKEATLVRSWLDIVGRSASDWQFEFDVAEAIRDARLPALVLLPLVQRAVAETGSGALRLRVTAQDFAGRLRLDVWTSTAALAGGIAAQPMLAQIDERLRALHGTEARFEAGASVGNAGSEAHIELPLESAPAVDVDERPGRP